MLLPSVLARLDRAPRTASLIVTVFGDVAAPRGGALWLGSLQPILDCFGLNHGQVRTAMSRLTEEGWLARERRGRLSFHRLGPRGLNEMDAAARRIYAAREPGWDGVLRLVLADDAATREALARAGFGTLAPGVMASPTQEPPPGLPVLLARPRDAAAGEVAIARAFPLEALALAYEGFLGAFGPLATALPEPAPLEALTLRILLVHEFRRLVLRDPALPAALLPRDWPGRAARSLVAELYHRLLPAAEAWLDEHASGPEGPLPPAGALLAARFSGG